MNAETSTSPSAWSFTKAFHKESYPAISPSRPENNQAGKVVVITGGSTGIGYGIAHAFAAASASRVIITGRRSEVLQSSVVALSEKTKAAGSETVIDGRCLDVTSIDETLAFWQALKNEGIIVDVLVLNAATSSARATILELGRDKLWQDFVINVRTLRDWTEHFYKQENSDKNKRKYLINVSTSAVHMWYDQAEDRPGYGLTKNSGTLLVQQIAKDVKFEEMQIVSFHPGGVFTEAAKNAGYTADMFPDLWDHIDLGSHFAVWAATPQAEFLHGRAVWSKWDIDEVKTGDIRRQIDSDPHFLKIGVKGW